MCAMCGCGKKKGQPGFGKGPKKKAAKKAAPKGMSSKQKKLDADKDGKLEGSDFAALRGKKKK
jgi:hypothetical protein